MSHTTRILVIDNLAVESLRREVYRALATLFECELHLLVPTGWKETREAVTFEPEEGKGIQLHASRILFGFRHQRVLYLDLPRVLREVKPHFVLVVAQPESYAGAQVCIDRRMYAPNAGLGFFSSRNIDYPREGFPYRFKFTHRLCDTITQKSQPDICFYRPQAAGNLLAPYAKRMTYVPHVVDCSLFKRAGKERPNGGGKSVRIGYVGRLVREKGVYVLLEAMRSLPAQLNVLLVGAGPEEEKLRQTAFDYGLSERVEFHPPVPYGEVPSILNGMDLLVLPSLETKHWTELFGRILVEAMACEVPVIASRSGGIPEVIGDAGVLVEPGNRPDLASAIGRLCADPSARRELGQKGRKRAVECFDVPVVARILGREIMEIISSIAAEKNRA